MQIADGAGHFFLFDPVHHPHQDLAGIDVFDEDPLAAGKGQDCLLALLRVFAPAAATVASVISAACSTDTSMGSPVISSASEMVERICAVSVSRSSSTLTITMRKGWPIS